MTYKTHEIIDPEDTKLDYDITAATMRIAVYIDELIRSNEYTYESFATEMNVDVDTVKLWLSGTYDFELSLLHRIFAALNTELNINICAV